MLRPYMVVTSAVALPPQEAYRQAAVPYPGF